MNGFPRQLRWMLTVLLTLGILPNVAKAADRGRILVLVDGTVQSQIRWQLGKYLDDLRAIGYTTTVLVQRWPDGLAVRETIVSGNANNLCGAVLIGAVPIPHLSRDSEPRPCPLALMDLDGHWKTNPDGTHYVQPPPWPEIAPEIWVGVIAPNARGASRSEQLRTYFNRLHAYRSRHATRRTNGAALLFVEPEWARLAPFGLEQLYPRRTAVVSDSKKTTAARLKFEFDRDYEFVSIVSHNNGGFAGVGVEGKRNGESGVTSGDVKRHQPGANFYHLFSCSLCCPTKPDYFGGALLFSSGGGLLVHGTTTPGGMNQPGYLYRQWLATGCFGEAMKQWYIEEIPRDMQATNRRWYLGAIVLGDPTLSFPGG